MFIIQYQLISVNYTFWQKEQYDGYKRRGGNQSDLSEFLYLVITLLHENFAVSRLGSKNREIKMPWKMILELDREIKMSRKMVKRNREIKMHTLTELTFTR